MRIVLILLMTMSTMTTARAQTISDGERTAMLQGISQQLLESYVDEDVARRMSQDLQHRWQAGEYSKLSDGASLANRLTNDLRAISNDGHVRVQYNSDPAKVMPEWNTPTPEDLARYRQHAKESNYGFVKMERMDGNIGYLRIDELGDPELGGGTAGAAMEFVAGTDALIIDLRNNGGGHPGMVTLLVTYLLNGPPVHLSDFHIRGQNRTIQTWTLPYVPGRRYLDRPVFVLIGPGTFSGAEGFAYTLQSLGRATIVGSRTGGAAHPGAFVRVSDHFAIFIPNGRPVDAITKSNWERTGVQPDVEVADENRSLDRAHALALEAVQKLREPKGAGAP